VGERVGSTGASVAHDYRTTISAPRDPLRDRIALAAILILAAVLRLVGVGENPWWFADEGTHIDIASHLAAGRIQYMGVQDSTMLFAKPPLFHAVLALLLRAGGGLDKMLVLRTLTGVLGTACVWLLYLAVRRWSGGGLPLLAALALAVFPQAILYSRFGFSYNLLALLVLASFWALGRYQATGSFAAAATAAAMIGLGTTTDVAGFMFVPPFALLVWWLGGMRLLLRSLPVVFVPGIVYASWMLLRAPEAFAFDLAFTATRVFGSASLAVQVSTLVRNLRELLTDSVWIAIGLSGVLFARPSRLAGASALMIWLPLLNMGRVAPLNSLSAYYLIPLFPFLALGVAAFVARILAWTQRHAQHAWSERTATACTVLAAVIVAVPFLRSVAALPGSLRHRFTTRIDRFLIDPGDARRVAEYVNERIGSDDAVLATPAIAWLIHGRAVDVQVLAAAGGVATAHLPGNVPATRFAFPMSLDATRFAIVDDLWQSWIVHFVPGADKMLVEVEAWPRVCRAGPLRVYRNPR
jgi:4-amino-4-deoxy-L-arabinose transferase-like glycosyltransferase